MRKPLPVLSHDQRVARAEEKQEKVLIFLADGEVFTSAAIAAKLLDVSVVNARRTLSQLEKQSFLKKERHYIEGRQCDIFGLTQSGLAAIAADPGAPIFELGRSKSEYLRHKLECQRIRLICEGIGGSFTTERKLRGVGLKKIPDGLWSSDEHGRIAIEVEREAKTLKRMTDVFERHLIQMEGDERYDMCLYLVPDRMRKGMLKLLQSVPIPKAPDRDDMQHKRFTRFAMASLEHFPVGDEVGDKNKAKSKMNEKVQLDPEYVHSEKTLKFERIWKPEELD